METSRHVRCLRARHCLRYFSVYDSVVPLSFPVALFSGFITFAIMKWATMVQTAGKGLMDHPNVFQFFLTIASLLVAFHVTSAYNRYWEGRSALQSMGSHWSQAASSILAEDEEDTASRLSPMHKILGFQSVVQKLATKNSSLPCMPYQVLPSRKSYIETVPQGGQRDPGLSSGEHAGSPLRIQTGSLRHGDSIAPDSRYSKTPKEGKITLGAAGRAGSISSSDYDPIREAISPWVGFRAQCVHLMSALHATSIHYLLGPTDKPRRLEILGGLNVVESQLLRISPDQTFHIFHWTSHFVNTFRWQNGSYLPTAVSTRFLSLLCQGMNEFDRACKIEDTPFPFPYTQVMYLLDIAVVLMTPVVVACWVQSIPLAVVMTVLIVFTFHSVFATAHVMENPFGTKVNDLPLLELHEDFIERLLCLVNETTGEILNTMCNNAFDGEIKPVYHQPHKSKRGPVFQTRKEMQFHKDIKMRSGEPEIEEDVSAPPIVIHNKPKTQPDILMQKWVNYLEQNESDFCTREPVVPAASRRRLYTRGNALKPAASISSASFIYRNSSVYSEEAIGGQRVSTRKMRSDINYDNSVPQNTPIKQRPPSTEEVSFGTPMDMRLNTPVDRLLDSSSDTMPSDMPAV